MQEENKPFFIHRGSAEIIYFKITLDVLLEVLFSQYV